MMSKLVGCCTSVVHLRGYSFKNIKKIQHLYR